MTFLHTFVYMCVSRPVLHIYYTTQKHSSCVVQRRNTSHSIQQQPSTSIFQKEKKDFQIQIANIKQIWPCNTTHHAPKKNVETST